jgi:hypothetical protein
LLFGGYAHAGKAPADLRATNDLAQPGPVPHLPPAKPAAAGLSSAGAMPRAAADSHLIDLATGAGK